MTFDPIDSDSPDSRFDIEIKNTRAIELDDLADSFRGISEQYKRYLLSHPDVGQPLDAKLYIKEIKTGSVYASLIEYAQLVLPTIQTTVTLVGFATHLKSFYQYFLSKSGQRPKLEKSDYQQLSNIINPVAKDNGSQMNFNTVVNGNIVVNIGLNSIEANAAQNSINRELLSLREPQVELQKKVVLYWYQTRDDVRAKTGDKAIVESISGKPVKVEFVSDSIKMILLASQDNPYHYGYIVSLGVETIEGEPVLYRILEIHDRIPKPASPQKRKQIKR